MATYWTSKHGTKIDVTGLDAKTLAEVKKLADSKYGTKAAEIAKTYQTKNNVASSVNKPGTSTTGSNKTLPNSPASNTVGKTDFSDPNSVAKTDVQLKKDVATGDTVRANPNEIGPGYKKTVTYGPDGQPTVETELTGPNKELDDSQKKTGTIGSQVAGNLIGDVGSYDPNSVDSKYAIPTVDSAYQSRYQQAAYDAMTRNLEKRYQQSKEEKAQELINQGIPMGSPQFNARMQSEVEDVFNEQRQAAENNSYASGLNAANTNFGMGLQANQAAMNNYNTSFGNKVAWGGALNNMASPTQANTQPFQAAQTQPTDVTGIHGTTVGANMTQKQIDAQKEIARINAAKRNTGGQKPDNSPGVDL